MTTPMFQGYGGSDPDYETLVYTYRGIEIRIPVMPAVFDPESVSSEYGCFSALTLDDAVDDIDEMAPDYPGLFTTKEE